MDIPDTGTLSDPPWIRQIAGIDDEHRGIRRLNQPRLQTQGREIGFSFLDDLRGSRMMELDNHGWNRGMNEFKKWVARWTASDDDGLLSSMEPSARRKADPIMAPSTKPVN